MAKKAEPVTESTSEDPFIQEVTGELMRTSGMISSSDTKIEKAISSAMGNIEGARDATRSRIESEYSRNRNYTLDKNAAGEEGFKENRAGYATPVVAFSRLREDNAKAIRDLDQRKNELILQGDALAAEKLSDLTIKKLEFEQDAVERTFNSLIAMGNFGLSARRDQREEENQEFTHDMENKKFGLSEKQYELAVRGQTFQEKSAMGAIALQYGIEVKPGDDIDAVINRAQPFASAEQKLKMDQIRASIYASNASAKASLASAAASARANRSLSAAEVSALAAAYRTPNGAAIVAASVKDPSMLSQIFGAAAGLETQDVKDTVNDKLNQGWSMKKTMDYVNSLPQIQNSSGAAQIVAETYANNPIPPQPRTTLPGQLGQAGSAYSSGVNGFLSYLTGIPTK